MVLRKLDLVSLSSDRLLLVFHLQSGAVRTIFVEIPGTLPAATVQRVGQILNERLAGLTLQEIRTTLSERLRDAEQTEHERELLNIFVQEGEEIFGLRRARRKASCWAAPRCWQDSRSSPPVGVSGTCWR